MNEELLDQVSEDRIREHIRTLEGVRHRLVAPDALDRAEAYITSSFDKLGYRVEPQPFSFAGKEFRNLVATIPGTGDPGERLLVVAHYDTVENSPGADDNASGVAVLLELARVLKTVKFSRAVQFVAVNLEERQVEGQLEQAGLFGSRALAAEAEKQNWKIAGVVVLETIAYAGKHLVQKTPVGMPVSLPECGDFIGVIGNAASSDLVGLFVKAIQKYRIPLPAVPLVVPGNGEVLPDTRRSDHAPFWDKGFKAIMLTDSADFRNPNYHQPTDTLETLNLAFAAQVCRATAGMVIEAAS